MRERTFPFLHLLVLVVINAQPNEMLLTSSTMLFGHFNNTINEIMSEIIWANCDFFIRVGALIFNNKKCQLHIFKKLYWHLWKRKVVRWANRLIHFLNSPLTQSIASSCFSYLFAICFNQLRHITHILYQRWSKQFFELCQLFFQRIGLEQTSYCSMTCLLCGLLARGEVAIFFVKI